MIFHSMKKVIVSCLFCGPLHCDGADGLETEKSEGTRVEKINGPIDNISALLAAPLPRVQ